MDIPDHVMFVRRLAELTGESRDCSLRPLLEKQVRILISELFLGYCDLASKWFVANISLVINLERNAGTIFLGKDEAMEYFKKHYDISDKNEDIRLNFVLVSVDRGRVTSHVELFSVSLTEDEKDGPPKKEVLLIIMDLDSSNMIKRMEVRLLCMEYGEDEDRALNWRDTVKKMGNKPVVIDYTI
ncbi:hypothetical protein K4K51_007809 [Colletotrichum sp. SAR 10_75]|nr:hypothetical protein K4K51_007809 [Colletotrichum sp. SAR 10_75]